MLKAQKKLVQLLRDLKQFKLKLRYHQCMHHNVEQVNVNYYHSGLVRRPLPGLSDWQSSLWQGGEHSQVFAAVGTQDVVFTCQETSTDQGHAALFAVEAVVVPLALLKRDVLAASET